MTALSTNFWMVTCLLWLYCSLNFWTGIRPVVVVDAFDHSAFPIIRTRTHGTTPRSSFPSSTCLRMVSPREQEIRRKIQKLKQEGRLSNKSGASSDPSAMNDYDDDDDYSAKVRQKLGKSKSRLLGFDSMESISSEEERNDIARIQNELDQVEESAQSLSSSSTVSSSSNSRMGQIGARTDFQQRQGSTTAYLDSLDDVGTSSSDPKPLRLNIDPSLFDENVNTDPEPPELTEEELVELVAEKLAEKRKLEDEALEAAAKIAREKREQAAAAAAAVDNVQSEETQASPEKTTSGVGGSWNKDGNATQDMYKPKSGSWGAFPRPRDISKTYGGGRRVGVGFSKEDDEVAKMNTQNLLKDYRRKVGIDVPTEKEHAAEIEEALQIGQLAMQRGIYATAVSALEKVTQWCSTNSKVGSKVYLELAMAYEALGRTKEAYQVYKTLSECRMEDVKYNAKRLLYGLEAMEVMRDVSADFSRTKTKNTFIETTGLDTIAQNFDDVYNTAYIDLESGFYKRLTESVVRSNREARQILIKATGKGEVGRTRVVQALRCLSRQFDESLQSELAASMNEEPTAFLNGKPIVKGTPAGGLRDPMTISLGDFQLLGADEMLRNLGGKWKLQLLADKSGDGVSFFNTTTAEQEFHVQDMTFQARGPSGLVTVQSIGRIEMEDKKRILSKSDVETSGGGAGAFLNIFRGGKDTGFIAAVSRSQQVIIVDSVLLITKSAPGTRKGRDSEKEYFAVWRRDSADRILP